TADRGDHAQRYRASPRRAVQRHQAREQVLPRRAVLGLVPAEDLDPDPFDRYQRGERLDLLRLRPVPLVLGEYRDVGPAALHHGGVRAQVATPAEAGLPDLHPLSPQVLASRRRYRRDRPWWLWDPVVCHALSPSGAPCWFINGTGSTAPAELLSPLRCTS